MKLDNDFLRLSSITLLLAVTISLAAPSAMAMPGLGTGTTPAIPVQGQVITLDFIGTSAATHNKVSFRVYEAGLTAVVPTDGAFVDPCTSLMPSTAGAGGVGVLRVWELRHGGVVAQLEITSDGDTLTITFGTGATKETIMYNGVPITGANIDDAGVGDFHWEQIADSPTPGAQDDSTGILAPPATLYRVIDCGDETAGNPGFFDGHDFATQLPIGGEILQINTAALLIAGINTNLYSILGVLTMVGVAAFGALYYTTKRQN